jgi:hypothetical protein
MEAMLLVVVLLEKLGESFFKRDRLVIGGVKGLREIHLTNSQKNEIYGELIN